MNQSQSLDALDPRTALFPSIIGICSVMAAQTPPYSKSRRSGSLRAATGGANTSDLNIYHFTIDLPGRQQLFSRAASLIPAPTCCDQSRLTAYCPLGHARLDPVKDADAQTVFKREDEAMYERKDAMKARQAGDIRHLIELNGVKHGRECHEAAGSKDQGPGCAGTGEDSAVRSIHHG